MEARLTGPVTFHDVSYAAPNFTSPPLNPDGFVDKAAGPAVTEQYVQATPQSEQRAFLPMDSEESQPTTFRRRVKTFPLLGLSAIAGSGLTVLLSLTILLLVNNRVVWSNVGWGRFMRPASWLSALLSANSVFLHVALTEGVTTAWWFRATRADATVRDLHDVWSHGTSLSSALTAGRRMSYVSMATIFLGLLPLNGFLLQGAISTYTSSETTNTILTIPSVRSLPLGYSGTLSDDKSSIDLTGTAFDSIWLKVLNLEASHNAQYAYFGGNINATNGAPMDFGCEESSICTGTVIGTGFHINCDKDEEEYYLLPNLEDNQPASGRVFHSDFSWSFLNPNTISVYLSWKENEACTGALMVRNCTLEAATVEYPVQVQMNDSSPIYPGPYFSLLEGTSASNDTVVDILPVNPYDADTDTIYGGISTMFRQYFNSDMNITTWPRGNGTYYVDGHLPISLAPGFGSNPPDGPSYFNGYCNMTWAYPLQDMGTWSVLDSNVFSQFIEDGYISWQDPVDLADVVLAPLRRSMFLASIYQGSLYFSNVSSVYSENIYYHNETARPDFVQEIPGVQVKPVTRYTVRFYLWGASLAITYTVIGFVLPLFWGFWVLKRKPTMSPVDIARAFRAPILSEIHDNHEVRTLLKHHGRRSVHYDLIPSPDSYRRTSTPLPNTGYFDYRSSTV